MQRTCLHFRTTNNNKNLTMNKRMFNINNNNNINNAKNVQMKNTNYNFQQINTTKTTQKYYCTTSKKLSKEEVKGILDSMIRVVSFNLFN